MVRGAAKEWTTQDDLFRHYLVFPDPLIGDSPALSVRTSVTPMDLFVLWLFGIWVAFILIAWLVGIGQWIARNLESPEKKAERERLEAARKHQAELDLAKLTYEAEKRRHEYELAEMREKWQLFQNVYRVNTLNSLAGAEFEFLVAQFFEAKGYAVEMVGRSGDFGVDLIATKGPEKLAVQVKRHNANIGPSAIQQAYAGGSHWRCNAFAVATSSYFTDAARTMAKSLGVRLYERGQIGGWLETIGIGSREEFSEEAYARQKEAIERLYSNFNFSSRRARNFRRFHRGR
jgi:restriction system protein